MWRLSAPDDETLAALILDLAVEVEEVWRTGPGGGRQVDLLVPGRLAELLLQVEGVTWSLMVEDVQVIMMRPITTASRRISILTCSCRLPWIG